MKGLDSFRLLVNLTPSYSDPRSVCRGQTGVGEGQCRGRRPVRRLGALTSPKPVLLLYLPHFPSPVYVFIFLL